MYAEPRVVTTPALVVGISTKNTQPIMDITTMKLRTVPNLDFPNMFYSN